MPAARRTPVGLSDVAQRAGVSKALVSRVLNQDPTLRLRPETEAAVRQAARDLGYVPNHTARALRTSRNGTLGIILNGATSPMFDEMVKAASQAAAERGYFLVLVDAGEVTSGQQLFGDLIAGRRVDGLLIQGGFGEQSDELTKFARQVPSVFFNASGAEGISGVRLDDRGATVLATTHLTDLGHRHLAFVAGPAGETSDTRVAGFEAAVSNLDGAVSEVIRAGSWSPDDCHAAVRAYVAEGGAATALVVVNTLAATGVLSGLWAAGKSVPGEVSVVAIHDAWFAKHLYPPLTTVRLPLDELGRVATQKLIETIRTGQLPTTVIATEPCLVQRQSTAEYAPEPESGQLTRTVGR